MDNKIIDINEWLRWVIKKHPSQKQITTIKKYWSCHTIKDYCTKFKNDIRKDIYDKLKQNNFEAEWKENSYSWDLDRLFDIQKFVKDCPQLSKVNIGYFAIQDTINSSKYKDYIQVIKQYNKEIANIPNNGPYTFRIIKLDFGVFQVYCRQSRILWKEHSYVMNSNETDEELEKQNGYNVAWEDDQVIFMSIPILKINKDLLKGNTIVELQKTRRLYCLNDNKDNRYKRYKLPELYYPTNIKTFIDYCIDNKLLPFNKSNIRIWSKADNFEIYNGDDYLEEEKKLCRYPFPMKNIKTEKELDLYIKEQKKKKALEKSLKIPEAMQLIYRKNDIFIPINNITQKDCDNFINNYNNRNLYEIIKYE